MATAEDLTTPKKAPLQGFTFNVRQEDGSIATVTLHVGEGKVIERILGFEHLGPLLKTTTPPQTIPSKLGANPSKIPGITKKKNADGSMTPVADEELKRNLQFLVPSIPCWFPECEQMRKDYDAEVIRETANWMRRHPGRECPGCVTGAVNKRYLILLSEMDTRPR